MTKLPHTGPTQDSSIDGASWIVRIAVRYHLLTQVIVHVVLFTASLLLAFMLRFDATAAAGADGGASADWAWRFWKCLPFFLIVKLLIFGKMRLFRGGWRYASIRDVTNILLASWWFVLTAFVMWMLFYRWPQSMVHKVPYLSAYFKVFPKTVLVLDFLGTVFLVSTVKLGFRLYREELRPVSAESLRRVLLVGAGDAAEAIIREIHRMRIERYRVVGMVDNDPAKRKIMIHGISVLGRTEDIREICEDNDVEEIIIAIPSASRKELQKVIDLCSGTKLQFQSLPGVADLIDGRVTVSQIRPVDIDDLAGVFNLTGIDGVIATNTTISRDAVAGHPYADEKGGLSGAPVAKRSTEVIRRLRAALNDDIPVIGVGGILSAEDAAEKLDAGAALVQVYTGLIYRGPRLVREIAEMAAKRE